MAFDKNLNMLHFHKTSLHDIKYLFNELSYTFSHVTEEVSLSIQESRLQEGSNLSI